MYKIKKLKNNSQLILVPMQGTKTLTILVMFAAGSKYENRENNGISHFLEHMFFKGTKKRPNTISISSELDSLGAEFNAFTSKEYTGYWIKIDNSKAGKGMDILSDMLLNSKFSNKEINLEKGVILEEVNMYHDNPMLYIEDIFEDCLYGDNPAGWDTLGTKENISKFSQKDFKDYLSSHYSAEKMFVCLAGNLKDEHIIKANGYFEKFKNFPTKEKEPVKENQNKPQIKIHYKDTSQATFSLGVRTFANNHPDKLIAKMLSVILGGSMSSRLFIKLRERKGLAYFVKTHSDFYTDSGYLTTTAGVPVGKLEEAINIILDEYRKISKILVSPKELKKNKDLIKGRSVLQLEPSDNKAIWHTQQAVLGEKIISPENYYKKINQIKSADIKRVAKNIFNNENLNLAIIGPYKSDRKFKKILNF